ncbi:MAG: fdxN element excision recombinase XisF [Nodosilinea sp.]
MKLVGYARVSKQEQAKNSNALDQQINRLVREGVEELFVDVQSGREDERPNFEKLVSLIRSRQVDGVVITRDDRITRHGSMTMELLDLFEKTGVHLRILDGGSSAVDFANPYEWKQRAQAGIDSEYEVRLNSLKIRKGYEFFREEGRANVKPPFGYKRVDEQYSLDTDPWKDTGFTVLEVARGTVEAFLEMRTLQGTCRLVDERFSKAWTANGLRCWLLNPTLLGHTPYKRDDNLKQHRQIVYNTHTDRALMSQAELDTIKEVLAQNKSFWGANRSARRYPLGGLMFCGECGTKMTVARSDGRVYVWCRQRKNKISSKPCGQKKTPRMETIEAVVIQSLTKRAESISAMAEVPSPDIDPPELQALKVELAYYQNAPGSRAASIVADLRQQIEAFKQKQQVATVVTSEQRDLLLQVFGDPLYWKTLMDEEKREIYRALVERVIVKNGGVERVEVRV